MVLWQLFLSFAKIGMFSFGGGYAALPMIQDQVVHQMGWLTVTEFTDVVTISQMTPGPIIINSATFVGYRLGGIPGAIAATLGSIAPAIVIVIGLALLYQKYQKLPIVLDILAGIQPAVMALIAAACVTMIDSALGGEQGILGGGLANISIFALVLMLVTLFAIRKTKLDSMLVMAILGLVGGTIYYFIQ